MKSGLFCNHLFRCADQKATYTEAGQIKYMRKKRRQYTAPSVARREEKIKIKIQIENEK